VEAECADLEPSLGAPRAARKVVERFLRNHGMDPLVDDALLLTSELVANSVQHAATG
jgi:hypothetical protein